MQRWAYAGNFKRLTAWIDQHPVHEVEHVAATVLAHSVRGRFALAIQNGGKFMGHEKIVSERHRRIVLAFSPHFVYANAENCPLVESIHYRLRSLTKAMASSMRKEQVRECVLSRDSFGRSVWHVVSESKAPGFARYYFRSMTTEWRRINNEELGLEADFNASASSLSFRELTESISSIDLVELVELARDVGVDAAHILADEFDSRGWTPLLAACYGGRLNVVQYMLSLGIDAPSPGKAWNETCLHVAASRGYADIARLFAQSSSTSAQDAYGRTAWDIACELRHESVAQLLKPGAMCAPEHAVNLTSTAEPSFSAKVDLGWGNAERSASRPNRLFPSARNVPRRSQLSRDEFIRDFFSLNRPVIFTDIALDWPAFSAWTKASFKSTRGDGYGHLSTLSSSVPYGAAYGLQTSSQILLGDFVEKFMVGEEACTLDGAEYVFDGGSLLSHQRFAGDVVVPAFALDLSPSATLHQLAVGPCGSGVSSHFHPWALNTLVAGRKRWTMTNQGIFHNPNFRQAFPGDVSNVGYEAIQYPGETIFVPSYMSHAVRNELDSIACAFEFV